MKKKILYGVWAAMYALCAGLAHIPDPAGSQRAALTILGVLFFVPGFLLLAGARRSQDEKELHRLRLISAISLGLTLVGILLNIFSALGPDALGTVVYEVLIFVSVPMICAQYWVVSLFLWACILFAALSPRKTKK